MDFRLQRPDNLVTRLFMLQGLRKLDYVKVKEQCKFADKAFYTYHIEVDGKNKEEVDVNWEFLLFEATLFQIEKMLTPFIDELSKMDEEGKKELYAQADHVLEKKKRQPVDINIMDLARAEIANSKNKIVT